MKLEVAIVLLLLSIFAVRSIITFSRYKVAEKLVVGENYNKASEILETIDRTDTRTYTQISIRCKPSVVARAVEYLRGRIIETYENGDLCMELTVDESEFFWFGALLAMGDAVEVLAPESVRERVRDSVEKIAKLYS